VIAVPHPITRTVDYYSVPSMLACRKERATVFHRWWRKLIGPSRLLYTRSDEGRLLVLRSCAKALAAGTAPTHEIRNRWI
jgi:hypothetical protein